MNLSEIVANVKATVNPVTNIDNLIKRWANRAQKKFVMTAGVKFSWLDLTELQLPMVSGVREYALSPLIDMAKVVKFNVRGTSPRTIRVLTRQEFQERIPDPTFISIGFPTIAYHSGFTPVQNQPSSTSAISFVSTSSLDTAVIKIEGLDTNGVLQSEEVTLNGVNVVTTQRNYSQILGRGINGFMTGTVTMTSNGGTVINSVISPRMRQGLHPKVVFYPTPSGGETIFYDGTMRLPPLVVDNDFSLMPEDYHGAIEAYCEMKGFKLKKDYQSAAMAKQDFEEFVAQAVEDDQGPEMPIVMRDYIPNKLLDDDDLPGNYPRY